MPATQPLSNLLKILADDIRLRVLGLLAREELAVGELARVLGLSPSRLANHLRILREADLVVDRREGTWRFVRLNRQGGLPGDLWDVVDAHLSRSESFSEDVGRLAGVLEERRKRSRRYFEGVADVWDAIGSDFETGVGRLRVAAQLLSPGLVVADVGSGTGYLAAPLADLVARVILVDHSPSMLQKARRNLEGATAELAYRVGELDSLPLRDREVDAVLAGLVLHHAPDLGAFLNEAWRVLRPGGVLVVQDLLPHREGWMRDHMADLRLGMDPEELKGRVRRTGFQDPAVEILPDSYRPEHPDGSRPRLPLFLLRARKKTGSDQSKEPVS